MYCTSVDPAPSDSSTIDADYNVVLTTAIDPATGTVYIVHYDRERIDPGQLVERIFSHYRAYKPMVVKIESVAYQRTLCYWVRKMQEQLKERFFIEEVKNARISKAARILGLQPWFSAGKVVIKTDQNDLERELLGFDAARKYNGHDDIIDALSMQVEFWSRCCENYNVETKEDAVQDVFSGAHIIEELLDRVKAPNRYPYDIGNMKERIEGTAHRNDYMYS